MTDNEIKKALECCCSETTEKNCGNCPLFNVGRPDCYRTLAKHSLDLINRQQAENENLEYKLLGVMHFVDKWLDGAELEQDEVNRASAMREKTLQLVEKKQAEIERLQSMNQAKIDTIHDLLTEIEILTNCNFELAEKGEKVVIAYKTAKAEAIKEFAEKCKKELRTGEIIMDKSIRDIIDNLVKEMVGDTE
jgi:hypothetical protein